MQLVHAVVQAAVQAGLALHAVFVDAVEQLLDLVGDFTERQEARGVGAALQRVHGARQLRQHRRGMRVTLPGVEQLVDVLQRLDRRVQEQAQQLGIGAARGGCARIQRLQRNGRVRRAAAAREVEHIVQRLGDAAQLLHEAGAARHAGLRHVLEQRLGAVADLRHRLDLRHVGAALHRVQRARHLGQRLARLRILLERLDLRLQLLQQAFALGQENRDDFRIDAGIHRLDLGHLDDFFAGLARLRHRRHLEHFFLRRHRHRRRGRHRFRRRGAELRDARRQRGAVALELALAEIVELRVHALDQLRALVEERGIGAVALRGQHRDAVREGLGTARQRPALRGQRLAAQRGEHLAQVQRRALGGRVAAPGRQRGLDALEPREGLVRVGVGVGALRRGGDRLGRDRVLEFGDARQPGLQVRLDHVAGGDALDPLAQRQRRVLQQFQPGGGQAQFRLAQAEQVGLELAGQRLDALGLDHRRGAEQRVQAARDGLVHRVLGPGVVLDLEPVAHRGESLARIDAEHLHQLLVGTCVVALGQAVRAVLQLHHAFRQRCPVAERGDGAGHRADRGLEQLDHRWRERPCAFKAAVQQVLHRPGELADVARADHAAAALERVEAAARLGPGVAVVGVLLQLGQVFTQRTEHFVGFAEEDVADFRVDFLARGRTHRLRERMLRVDGRRGHRRRRACGRSGRGRSGRGLEGRDGRHRGQARRRRRGKVGSADVETLHRGREVIDQALGVRRLCLQRLEVVLDAGHGVGETLGLRFFLAHERERRAQRIAAQHAHQRSGALALQHAQAGVEVAEQPPGLRQRRGVAGLQVTVHQPLQAGEVHEALAHQRSAALAHVEHRDRAGDVVGFIVARAAQLAHQRIVEAVLDAQQRGGDIEPQRVGGRHVLRVHAGQRDRLRLDHGLQAAQAEHVQRDGDAAQLLDRVLQLGRRLVAGAHREVDGVLDLREVLADFLGQLVQQRRVRAADLLAQVLDRFRRRQQARERIDVAQRGDARALAAAARDVVQELEG